MVLLLTLAWFVGSSTLNALAAEAGPHYLETSDTALFAYVAIVLINPLYEEFFAGAYVIRALEGPWGAVAAVAASSVLRMAYHTYQGQPLQPW